MIVVTGATGKVGREVVKQTAAVGVRVRAFVRDLEKAAPLKGRDVELFLGDFEKPASLDEAFRGAEKVFLATPPDPRQAELQGNAVDSARRAGVRHIVKLGALGSGPASPVSFVRAHAQIEAQIEASGVPWTFLRPTFFMQNMLMFAPSVAATGVFGAPMKEARISAVDVRDIASVAVAVLTGLAHEGRAYDVTGPEALSFSDMAAKLSAACGRKVAYVDVAPRILREKMKGAGSPEWLVEALLAIYAGFVAGEGEAVSPTVEEMTGYPGRSFDEFARENAAAFRGR